MWHLDEFHYFIVDSQKNKDKLVTQLKMRVENMSKPQTCTGRKLFIPQDGRLLQNLSLLWLILLLSSSSRSLCLLNEANF
jgi:hypothetical protein